MNILNVSINAVTKIHKELNRVGLIKDVWDDVGKPNIVYIKDCETPKPQAIHKTYETPKVEEKKEEIKPIEIKKEPIIPKVEELIKLAIRILVKKKREEDNLELLKKITTYEISYAFERCKNSVRNEELVINKLIKYIEKK